jgi:hypothetical protein
VLLATPSMVCWHAPVSTPPRCAENRRRPGPGAKDLTVRGPIAIVGARRLGHPAPLRSRPTPRTPAGPSSTVTSRASSRAIYSRCRFPRRWLRRSQVQRCVGPRWCAPTAALGRRRSAEHDQRVSGVPDSAGAVALIGPIDTSSRTVRDVEEGDARLLGHTTGVDGVLLVMGPLDKDLAGGVRMRAALAATDRLAVQSDLSGMTIGEWRRQRAASQRQALAVVARRRWRVGALAGAVAGARSSPPAKHGAPAGSQALRCASLREC